jgi:hypothetical protein
MTFYFCLARKITSCILFAQVDKDFQVVQIHWLLFGWRLQVIFDYCCFCFVGREKAAFFESGFRIIWDF